MWCEPENNFSIEVNLNQAMNDVKMINIISEKPSGAALRTQQMKQKFV